MRQCFAHKEEEKMGKYQRMISTQLVKCVPNNIIDAVVDDEWDIVPLEEQSNLI